MKQEKNSRSPFYSILSTFLAILLLLTSVPFFVTAASYFSLGNSTGEIDDQNLPDSTLPAPTDPDAESVVLGLSAGADLRAATVIVPPGETLFLSGTTYRVGTGSARSFSSDLQIALADTGGAAPTKIVVESSSLIHSIIGPNTNVELSFVGSSILTADSQAGGDTVHTQSLNVTSSGTLNIRGYSSTPSTQLRTQSLTGGSFNLTTSPNHVAIDRCLTTGPVNFNLSVGAALPAGAVAGADIRDADLATGSSITVNSTSQAPVALLSQNFNISSSSGGLATSTLTVTGGRDKSIDITNSMAVYSTLIKSSGSKTALSVTGNATIANSSIDLAGSDYGLYAYDSVLDLSLTNLSGVGTSNTVTGSKAGLYLKASPHAQGSIRSAGGNLTAHLTGTAGGLAAIYIDGANTNTDLWFTRANLNLISEQSHKGALLTYKNFMGDSTVPHALRIADASFSMTMPRYQNGYLWGLDLPTPVRLDSTDVTETYNDPITIPKAPTHPYDTAGDYLNYSWHSEPVTGLQGATADGFTTGTPYSGEGKLVGATKNSTQSNGQKLELGGFTPTTAKDYKVVYAHANFVNSHIISLDPGAGTIDKNFVPVSEGAPIGLLPIPVRDGYRFIGWFDKNGIQYTPETLYPFDASITVYADWVPIQNPDHLITYYTNGASLQPIEQLAKEGSLLVPPTVQRVGYNFEGWYKEADFKNSWNFSQDRVGTSPINLYAKWAPILFPVTFVTESGIPAPAKIDVAYGTKVPQPANPYKRGYTFLGWFYTPLTKQIAQEIQWDFTTNPMIGAPLTLTARWRYNGDYRPGTRDGTRRADGPVYYRGTKVTTKPSTGQQTVVTNPGQPTGKTPTTQALGPSPQGPLPQTGFAALRSASIGVSLVLLGGILLLSGSKHRKENTDETNDEK